MNTRKTKIIATIGPSTLSKSMIDKMIAAGMDIARINMSHYQDSFDLKSLVHTIRKSAKKYEKCVSIIMDLPGPKIRTSNLGIIEIKRGKDYTLGKDSDIPVNCNLEFKGLDSGAKVKIDDGKISFKVIKKISNSKILIRSKNNGEIASRKGVNISGLKINLPTLQPKDIKFAKMALNLGFDWIALSFVRSKKDREPLDKLFKRMKIHIPLIAKIEKLEAVKNISEIINSYDGVLIARGDLGLELELEQVPSLQKKIIRECNQRCKPVIVATQMLESMIGNPLPTRAEVSDVASAIYDGTDSIMLSGETAVGDFPLESIRMMKTITLNVEKEISKDEGFKSLITAPDKTDIKKSICFSAYQMSQDLSIKVMVIMTESGDTGNTMSSFRPTSSIIAMTPSESVYRKLSLSWGILPVKVRKFKSTDQMLSFIKKFLIDNKIIKNDELFIMTAGVPVGVTGTTNMIKIEVL